ncbi:MAG: hypothetical protein QOC81_804 [Thermoanaerobaculia bacterium]|jgi:hypothetical protein|nr:hypothetical protein [Thermoanaerobaculia bacterium]
MRRAQLFAGIAMVLAFLTSGLYMHFALNHLRGMPLAIRMVYRASHINMLLIGAFNIASANRAIASTPIARRLELTASGLAMAAAGFLILAFIFEPGFAALYRPWTRVGVYATFGAIFLEVVGMMSTRREAK